MKRKFKQTNWGLAFDFDDRLCFLSYNRNHSDILIDTEYDVSIFYKIMYYAYYYQLDRNTKSITKSYFWDIQEYKTKEEIFECSEYDLFKYHHSRLIQPVPYCRILTAAR